MIGYIGLGLLVIAYITMLTRYGWLFIIINFFASIALTIHAIILGDVPFVLVNGLVAIILLATFIKDKVWKHFLTSNKKTV